jgi:pimeloyl-ACP methyl ester carboxylesterase
VTASSRWISLSREGVELACLDYGGAGPPVILLHGLAGNALEWAATAEGLLGDHRVLALDGRGHGRSTRHPPSVTPDDAVADVVTLIEVARLAPVALVGQSLGGLTALLVAGRRPDLVRALVVAEASPAATAPADVEDVRLWLESWPLPFASVEEAEAFFGGSADSARAWASGLERRGDGWWPRFDATVVTEMLTATVGVDYWPEWNRIAAPTLVVRGSHGDLRAADANEMVARIRHGELVELDAGHDVHLDALEGWRKAVKGFLARAGWE